MSSLAPSSCSVSTELPLYTASNVSKLLPFVCTATGPVLCAVQRYQTLVLGLRPRMLASPGSAVARTLVPATVAPGPGMDVAESRLSLAGGLSAHCNLMSPCFMYPPPAVVIGAATGSQYCVPAVASNVICMSDEPF